MATTISKLKTEAKTYGLTALGAAFLMATLHFGPRVYKKILEVSTHTAVQAEKELLHKLRYPSQ